MPCSPASSSPSSCPSLEVADLTVTYAGEPVLEGLTLELPAASLCALVGRNGAGKSTLFRAVMGFLSPARGSVRIAGLPVPLAQRRQLVAYVPQSEQVDWQFPLRVQDVVLMGRYGHMNLLRLASGADRQAVEEALERLDLLPLADRQIGALSGGQRKRAFLARALAQGARLLLLDEPFTGVDLASEQLILDTLTDLRSGGASALIATHDLEVIPRFCDRVALLQRRLLASGPTEEVFTRANLLRTFGLTDQLPA